MLDLNYVRENLEKVKEALNNRNFPTDSLEEFVEIGCGTSPYYWRIR